MGKLLFSIVLASAGLLNFAGCGTSGLYREADGVGAYGTVRMIEQIDRPGEARVTVAGPAQRTEQAQRATTTFQYTVQMDTGELRTFAGDTDQGYRAGQRVLVVDGTLRRP